jgi:hypothetical protein
MGEENPKALNKELLDSLTKLATNLSAASLSYARIAAIPPIA